MATKYFGPLAWGPHTDDPEAWIPVPIGADCFYCEERIGPNDAGVMIEGMQFQHRECFIRMLMGSVGHQQKKCRCYGGSEDDPPTLTKRQAAIAAAQLAGLDAPFG